MKSLLLLAACLPAILSAAPQGSTATALSPAAQTPAKAEAKAHPLDAKVMALLQKAVPALTAVAAQADVVAEILKRNAEAATPEQAKAFQVRWRSEDPKDQAACRPYLDNKGSKFLQASLGSLGMTKVFTLDARGNLASTAPKAHDYLHGDQQKFQECFKTGKAVFNKPAKDLTSHRFSVQISVPILSEGKTVGVLVGTYALE